jgi:hypothetical protein
MSSSSPAPAVLLLSEQILQRRIDAGLAIAGGGRGSLTKALLTTSSSNNNRTAPALLLHLEMTKLALIVKRNELLLQKCRRQEQEQVEVEEDSAAMKNNSTGSSATSPPLSQRLRTKKQQPSQSQSQKPPPPPDTTTTVTNSSSSTTSMQQKLVTAKAVHGCWQSYEGLATAIVQKHVVSEAQLHQDIGIIDGALVSAQEQLQQAQATARTRAAQCHLLQQCVQDLQQSVVEEEQTIIVKEGCSDPDNTAEGKKSSNSKDLLDSDGDAVMKDDGDDEEGELYGDLDSLL